MFEKLFHRKARVEPETLLSVMSLTPGDELDNMMKSTPDILNFDDPSVARIAKVGSPPITFYQSIVFKLDILVQIKHESDDIIIPPGSFLQKVIYGKFKKLRVLPDKSIPNLTQISSFQNICMYKRTLLKPIELH